MTLALYFVPQLFPRTITRKEWRKIDRWRRVTQKQLAAAAADQMRNFAAFGSTMPQRMRDDFLNEMVNPPLLVHDRMDISHGH